jgi:Ca-activated chloride channel family protein
MIQFSMTSALVGLLLIPLMLAFFIWRWQARRRTLAKIGERALIDKLIARVHYRRRIYQIMLWLVALGAIIVALARPTWGETFERLETRQRQVIITLDLSRSMDAQDIVPSRLERAIFDIRQLLEALEGDDVGVVVFTNEAFTYVPLTYDLDAVGVYLNALTTEAITQQGTSLLRALETAVGAFDERADGAKSIVLMSDGESHEGDALEMAQALAEDNITLHVVGYGREEGAVIPVYDDGRIVDYKTDENGILVETRINRPLLEALADIGGGVFQLVDSPTQSILPVVDALQASRQGAGQETIVRVPVEQFSWFVLLALMSLSFEILIRDTRQA